MIMPIKFESEVAELQRQLAQVGMLTSTARRRDEDALLELLLLKRGNLKLKMYQEPGHNRPHIHIDYGREKHVASYAIDPVVRLVGTLDRKYDRTVTEWILSRKERLLNLWEVVQAGGEALPLVVELAGDA